MWPNSQFPADFVIFTGKSLTENFIFCAGGVKIIDVISKKSIVKSVIDLIVFQNLIDLLKLYTSCQALD